MYNREIENEPTNQVQSNGDHIEDYGSNDAMSPPTFALQQDSIPAGKIRQAKKSSGDTLMAALGEAEVPDHANDERMQAMEESRMSTQQNQEKMEEAKGKGSGGDMFSKIGGAIGGIAGGLFGGLFGGIGGAIGGGAIGAGIGAGIGSILGGLFGGGKKKKPKTGELETSEFKAKKRKVKILNQSYEKAAVMVNNSIPKAEKNHKHYQKYMDAGLVDKGATTTRSNHVKEGFKKVKKHIEKDKTVMKKWDLPASHKFKEANTYGYVRGSEKDVNIYLGKMFWKTKMTGRDSKAGTIVHELTHRIHGTKDHGYGIKNTLKFAKTDPAKAATNADNYEHFAEDA